MVTLGMGIVGRGRAVTSRAKRGESNDGRNAEVRSRRGAVVFGEGSSTCKNSSYWYVLISEGEKKLMLMIFVRSLLLVHVCVR